jgi:hypothetical protein
LGKHVELSEFVRRTIEEVVAGVRASHSQVADKGGRVAWSSNHSNIEFDVAVTTTEEGEMKKGGGIFVGGVRDWCRGKERDDELLGVARQIHR